MAYAEDYSDVCLITTSPVISSGNSPQKIVGKNSNRIGLFLYNIPGSIVYITLGQPGNTSTTVAFTIPASGYWVCPIPVWQGEIYGSRTGGSAAGAVVVTELL